MHSIVSSFVRSNVGSLIVCQFAVLRWINFDHDRRGAVGDTQVQHNRLEEMMALALKKDAEALVGRDAP